MAYEKQTWSDSLDAPTPITAARLQHIEDGIKALSDSLDSVSSKAFYVQRQLNSSDNLNNIIIPGIYLITNDVPVNNIQIWSILIVVRYLTEGPTIQLSLAGNIYYRCYTGSPLVWTSWNHLSIN